MSGVVTLSLPPFLVLLLLFLFQPAPVLGNITILMVAFYVQDLQVLQPPEGTFHHRAHGQLVKPVQATHVGSAPGPDRAHTDPAQKWSAGDGPSGKTRGKHKRRRLRSAGDTGSSSSSVCCCWGVGVTQCSGGKASRICALTMTWGGRHRHLLPACPLALTSRPEAPALPAWSRLGARCGGAHRQGQGQAGPGTHLGLGGGGRALISGPLNSLHLGLLQEPRGTGHTTPTSPSLAFWVTKPSAVHILPYSDLSPL